jgi:short-subunit dehydrogenase
MSLVKYGKNVLIAGGSEGLGAAFANAFAAQGMNLYLVARREEQLTSIAKEISGKYSVSVKIMVCDLGLPNSIQLVQSAIGEVEIDVLVYNAARPYIGNFESLSMNDHENIVQVNMLTPLQFVHAFGAGMISRKRGAIILMTSLAGRQGSGFIATYAATKAFNLILGESLWYEWRKHNVDVLACTAGATATPNFINSKPGKLGLFEPQVQTPEAVVRECLNKLGKTPSFISGFGNRLASLFMNKLFSRKLATIIMGNSVKKLYQLK